MKLSTLTFGVNAFIRYWFKATNSHSIHSPFLFELYNEVICSDDTYYAFSAIAALRAKLLRSNETIPVEKIGAGSMVLQAKHQTVSAVTKNFAVPEKYGQLLFRLVNHFNPMSIIELGTSLGISTLYLAMADSKSKVITIEGSKATADQAMKHFNMMHASNISVLTGSFDDTLPEALSRAGSPDFLFIDGNHAYEPTLRYFEQCLAVANNRTVFVFDDIHWSQGMERAWNEIVSHPSTTMCIDLFRLGIVFINAELSKEKFVLKW